MSKANQWAVSFTFFLIIWFILPEFRIISTVIILMHIPIFVWGIIDLRNSFFCKTFYHKKGESSRLALTFDDGPDPSITPDILKLLKAYNYRATFFIIAKKASKYPDLCKEVIRSGHDIGCHDLNHSMFCNFRFSKQMIKEIGEANSIIHSITGKMPRFYRPPVGLSNPHLKGALKKLKMICIGWSSSVRDAGNRYPSTFKSFHLMARPGSIILLHDTMPKEEYKKHFLEELERLLIAIRDAGMTSVTVEELLQEKAYNC